MTLEDILAAQAAAFIAGAALTAATFILWRIFH